MKWQTHSLRFRQVFLDGFRYLDRCGEFVLAAVDKFELLPAETKPTGASLSLPEEGLRATIDTIALEVVQEQPVDEALFLKIVLGLAALSQEKFGPLHVENSLFETKLFFAVRNAADVERYSLRVPGYDQHERAKAFGMNAAHQNIQTEFISGSKRLHIGVVPTTFEKINLQRINPLLASTASQIKRAKRVTAQADRVPKYDPYAIFLEVALSEMEPPLSSEESLYKLLLEKVETAKRVYSFL